jgi:hypothetical protein
LTAAVEYLPDPHAVHAVELVVPENDQAPQFEHTINPSWAVNIPASHLLQIVEPADVL